MALTSEQIQYLYKLIVIILYSFFITYWGTPVTIKKLKKYGYIVEDKYKTKGKKVATMGGIAILVGVLVSLALTQLLLPKEDLGGLFIFYFVIIIYGLFGVVDDLFSFNKRYDKILVLLILTFPIASLIKDTAFRFFSTHIEIGLFYGLLVVPIYIMVVANLINLHAGYNGLTQGLSLLLLISIGIKSYQYHGLSNFLYLVPMLGAVIGFYIYTKYPAKALPGNVGDFIVGATIGGLIVVNDFLWFGIFILIPHIVNFIMDTYTIVIRKIPDAKFGSLRKDGTVLAPKSMKYKSIKFLVVSLFNLTEPQAVKVCYLITGFFCLIGLIIF